MMSKKAYQKLGFTEEGHMRDFLARDDIQTIIGENYHHYRELWLAKFDYKVLGGPKPKVKGSFNWLALLSFMVWAAYRKLYSLYGAFVFVLAILAFIEIYYGFEMSNGGFLGVQIALAILSKDLYFSYLVECAKKLDKMQDEEKKAAFIARRAGVSKLYGYLAVPAAFVILFFVIWFAETIK